MQNNSDEALMLDYAKGSFAAFEHLYARHKGGLYRYLLRQLRHANLAEDMFQEVWGKVISSASDYQPSAQFNTWLYTIARNKVIDHSRHLQTVNKHQDQSVQHASEQEYESAASLFSTAANNTPEQQHQQQRNQQAIEHCLQKLPHHQLDCFLLKEEASMSGAQIAQVVNTGLEATKSRLRAAYKNLRDCLTVQLGDDLFMAQSTAGKSIQQVHLNTEEAKR